MNCPHKGCHQYMDPYIDPKTDKVYCASCDNELTNITHFAKMQMKSSKQYKTKQTKSFSIKCTFCSKEDRPIIIKDEIVCCSCKKPFSNLSQPFKIMLKEQLKTADKDV